MPLFVFVGHGGGRGFGLLDAWPHKFASAPPVAFPFYAFFLFPTTAEVLLVSESLVVLPAEASFTSFITMDDCAVEFGTTTTDFCEIDDIFTC